ncbi:MAG: cell division protein ZapA [Paraglaciecola psychrophila]
MSNDTVIVTLLDKEYQVACPEGQQAALRESANYLNQQMREIRASGKVIGLERIAVMAALNISNELLQNGGIEPATKSEPVLGGAQLKGLNDKLDNALHRYSQMEIG